MSLITVDYRDRKLIYEQLIDNVKALIMRGDLKKDDFLPSVRSLAKELGINPNTIQKAYTELERQGVIMTLQGRGSIVTLDRTQIARFSLDTLRQELLPLVQKALSLGVSESNFLSLAADCWQQMQAREENWEDDQN